LLTVGDTAAVIPANAGIQEAQGLLTVGDTAAVIPANAGIQGRRVC